MPEHTHTHSAVCKSYLAATAKRRLLVCFQNMTHLVTKTQSVGAPDFVRETFIFVAAVYMENAVALGFAR